METNALRELLAGRLGLDPESLGPLFLDSVARWCKEQSPSGSLRDFLREAVFDDGVWQRLLEQAVVCETWFFRDAEPFDLVAEAVRAKWVASGLVPVRVLSCPCSTGEEAYSVAVALTQAGLPETAFAIEAADVSRRAVRAAETGIYRARAFREGTFAQRAQYFDHDGESRSWRIRSEFKNMVKFRVANLVSMQGLEDAPAYDIVLCRNLLIYLHAQARASVMRAMDRLLTQDGVLILGHAEPAIAREFGFTGSGNSKAFAFVRNVNGGGQKPPSQTNREAHSHRRPTSMDPERATDGEANPAAMKAADEQNPAPSLEHIRKMGDLGKTENAIQACEEYVRRVPDSADGYFLLGVLYVASGQARASEAALRRALYLNPGHADALMHLALAQNAKGNSAAATRLLSRANPDAVRKRSEP